MSDETGTGKAELHLDGKVLPVEIFEGSEGEKAFDVRALRKETGMITYDPGYGNTGSCRSSITFIDGEKGILRHRGYSIEDLAEKSTFLEVSYLLIKGALPSKDELGTFGESIRRRSLMPEDLVQTLRHYPEGSHPMSILSAMVVSLSNFYREKAGQSDEETRITINRLLGKMPTIAAFSYRQSLGLPIIYPKADLSYSENFLTMMFDSPVNPYILDPDVVRAIDQFFILHADHEQNCSTSTVRLVGSGRVNLYAAISAGISALWGPLHGGANQAVIDMLKEIQRDGGNHKRAVEKAKDKKDPFRLMGFGHRVYKAYDPRAKIIKKMCDNILQELNINDPLLDLAKELEEVALTDDYFIEKNLYPNVDFYSGIVLRAMGIPTNMFTVMFAIGRLPGWIAQWKESMDDPMWKLGRPRQVYTGPAITDYIPMDQR